MDEEQKDGLNLSKVMKIAESRRLKPEGRSDVRRVADDIGKIRPKMTPDEEQVRRNSLRRKKEAVEYWNGLRTGQRDFRAEEIVMSDRKVSERLETEYFVMMGVLRSREYEKYTKWKDAANMVFSRWAQEALSLGDSFSEEENPIPTELVMKIRSKYRDEQLGVQVAKLRGCCLADPQLKEMLYKKIQEKIDAFTDEDKDELTAKAVMRVVDEKREKDRRAGRGEETTKGLEMEIASMDGFSTESTVEGLESMQKLGVPVTYDGTKELPMPYSVTIRDQLRALYEMVRAGVIPEGYWINFHLNFGGADWSKGLAEALMMLQIFDSAGLMRARDLRGRRPEGKTEKGLYWPQPSGDKKLLEEDDFKMDGPHGIPVRIRKSGVLELRWVGGRGAKSGLVDNYVSNDGTELHQLNEREFRSMVRDLATMGKVVEATTGYLRHRGGETKEKDERLAGV